MKVLLARMKNRLHLILSIVAFALAIPARADWKPTDNRLTTWIANQTVGVLNGIPTTRTQWCNAAVSIPGTAYVLSTTTNDNSAVLQFLYDNAPTNSFVYIPNGSYPVTNNILQKSGFSDPKNNEFHFEGESSTGTELYWDPPINTGATNLPMFRVGVGNWASSTGGFNNSTGGCYTTNDLLAGAYSVTISNTPSTLNFLVGSSIWIDATNDYTVVDSGGQAYQGSKATAYDRTQTGTRNRIHLAQITNITGNTIQFTPPIAHAFLTNQFTYVISPLFTRSSVSQYGNRVGFKNLRFRSKTNDFSAAIVEFSGGVGQFVTSCTFTNFPTIAIKGTMMTMGEISSNWIGRSYGASVNRGYGIDVRASGALLVENNIFDAVYIPIITGSSSLNVYAHNFIWNIVPQGVGVSQGGAININHGPYCTHILVEGNVGGRVHADFNHGSSGPMTVFRHYYGTNDLLSTENRSVIRFDRRSLSNVVAASILGGSNQVPWYYAITNDNYSRSSNNLYQLGFPAIGSNNYDETGAVSTNSWDTNVMATIYRHGNYIYSDYSTEWYAGNTNRTFEASLFRSAPPAYWNTNAIQWPSVGSDLAWLDGWNPARLRYFGLTNSPYFSGPPAPPDLPAAILGLGAPGCDEYAQ